MERRGNWFAATACAVVISLAFVASASARPLVTGVLDPEQSATANPTLMLPQNVAYHRIHDEGGGKIVRLYLYWNRVVKPGVTVEPVDATDPDSSAYDWTKVDAQVKAADDAELDVMLNFRSAPIWAQGTPGANSDGTYKPNASKLARFATAAATRYNGLFGAPTLPRVRYWEIWNEPNLAHFLRPQFDSTGGSPKLYRGLLNAAAKSVHAVNATNVVVAGGTAPFGNAKNYTPMAFLRQLLCMSTPPYHSVCTARVEADVFTHHPYTQGDPQHHAVSANNISLGDLPEWTALIRAARTAGHIRSSTGAVKSTVGLWATELGWDTNPPDLQGVPINLHARWTSEALYRIWQAGLTYAIWTQMRDYPMSAPCPWKPYQAGLYFDGADNPKLSLQAFRFPFVAYKKNGRISVWGRTPNGVAGQIVKIQRGISGGLWSNKKTLTAGAGGIFSTSWASTQKTGYYRATLDPADPLKTSVRFSLVRPADRTVSVFGTKVCS